MNGLVSVPLDAVGIEHPVVRWGSGAETPAQADEGRLLLRVPPGETAGVVVPGAPPSGAFWAHQWDEACRLTVGTPAGPLVAYRYSPVEPHPYFHPLVAPNAVGPFLAKSVTQDAPADHPHHRSLWYAHGHLVDAAGEIHDLWLEHPGAGRVVPEPPGAVSAGPLRAAFRAAADWESAGGRLLATQGLAATVSLPADGSPGFCLDLDCTLAGADDSDLLAGQAVDAGFPALRVADMIDLLDGGHVLDSEGRTDHDVAGNAARWCAAWGTLDPSPPAAHAVCGIALLDHPDNPGHPNRWFVRPFGWLTCTGTQFAERVIPAAGVRYRHRVVVFAGEADAAVLDAWWNEFAAPTPPAVRVHRGG